MAAVPAALPQVAGSSAPKTQQRLAGFPVMDLTRQMAVYGTDQAVSPPDTQLAAGPTYLVEADNSALSIWTKSGTLVASADLNIFFFEPAGYLFTDPRILYDTESGRWFLSGVGFTATNDSQIYVAVSTTSDPTGSWNVFLLGSGTGVLGDQPMIGVNSDKVVISWNDFTGNSPTTSTFSGQETWVVQKSDLVAGVAIHISQFGPDLTRFRIVPAQSLAPTATEWLSYNNADCAVMCVGGSPMVGVVAITGTPLMGNVTWSETDPAIAATTVPPNPRQPSGVPVVQDNDDRFISAVWQAGLLWVSGSDGCLPSGDTTTRSCMKLVAISTSGATPRVVQDFDAARLGMDLYYPAVTFNSSGDLFIGYSASSSTMYPSALAVDSLASSPRTFENPITLALGLNSYSQGSSNRWGDYSAAAPDPTNPSDVWVTAEYQVSATNPGDWGTATGRLAIQPSITILSPNFGVPAGGTSVTITGSHFQSGAAVSFASNPATNVVVISSGQITVTTPAGPARGPVDVTVSNPDGSAVTAPSAYTYEPPGPAVAVLPAVSNGAYGGYVTATTIQNTSTVAASIYIAYFDQNGAPVGGGDSIISLPMNASWTVRQDNGNSFPSSGGDAAQAGSAVVYSSQPVAAFVNEFAPGNVGDETSYSVVHVPGGVGTTLYVPTIVNNAYGGYTTGIGLLNEGGSSTNVTITYRDGSGATVKTQSVTALAAHAYHALFSGDATLALPSGFAGTATITSSAGQPLGAVVNEVGPGGQFSSYDAVPAGSTTLYAPVALRNAFGGYNTGMGIVNTSGSAGTVTISYYDASGTPTTTTAAIAAHGSLGVYQGTDIPVDGSYTAKITSTVAIAAIVNEVAASSTSAKQSTSYNTFSSGSATLHFPLVESAGSDGWSTGDGIMNTGTTTTTVTVNYADTSTGAPDGTPQSISLAPNAFWGLYQPTGGLPNGTRATAVITTSSGGQVAAICNESNTTTFMSYDGQ